MVALKEGQIATDRSYVDNQIKESAKNTQGYEVRTTTTLFTNSAIVQSIFSIANCHLEITPLHRSSEI